MQEIKQHSGAQSGELTASRNALGPNLDQISFKPTSRESLADALAVFNSCFELPVDRENAERSFTRLAQGDIRNYSQYHLATYEYIQSGVFYVDGKPAGIGGIYHLIDSPDTAYLGWFGVDPAFRAQRFQTAISEPIKLSDFILERMIEIAKKSGALQLSLFTANDASNEKIQGYYERRGFVYGGLLTSGTGEVERIYTKTLVPSV